MSQIIVLEKNLLDLDTTGVVITPADDEATNTGLAFVDLLRDRKNTSGWATTGSSNTATCTLTAELAAAELVSKVYLLGHNFKNFSVDYWSGIAWVSIGSFTNNTDTTTYISFTSSSVSKVRITITATMVANEDKRLAQLIVTDNLSSGVFEGYPEIKNIKHKTNKRISTMLSGKALVNEGTGAVEFELSYKVTSSDADLTLIEAMYQNKQGFLVCLSGGDETQFSTKRLGYRKQDVYFMRTVDDYSDNFYKSVYPLGTVIKMKLREAVL